MKQKDFTYAVARIRSKELGLLNAQHMEQLIGCKSFEEALHFLADRGWGSPDEPLEAERLLEGEMDRTWQTVEEMVDDKTVFDTLRVADDFHNLKAAIKQLYTGVDGAEREELCEKAEALLAEEVPVIPVYSYVSNALVNERIEGFVRINGGAPRFEYVKVNE